MKTHNLTPAQRHWTLNRIATYGYDPDIVHEAIRLAKTNWSGYDLKFGPVVVREATIDEWWASCEAAQRDGGHGLIPVKGAYCHVV